MSIPCVKKVDKVICWWTIFFVTYDSYKTTWPRKLYYCFRLLQPHPTPPTPPSSWYKKGCGKESEGQQIQVGKVAFCSFQLPAGLL